MSNETKTQIISAVKTFVVAFLVAGLTIISNTETISWTYAFWGAIATAGIRAGITAVIAPYIPVKLGGKKV